MDNPSTSAASAPVVYLLYGDDLISMLDFVKNLFEKVSSDPGMRELNTTHLEGRQAGEEEIRSAAYAMPFLAERRLVVARNPFERYKSSEAQQRLLALLDGLPPSTGMVFVIEDTYVPSGRHKGWQAMDYGGKFLRSWVEKNSSRAYWKICRPPSLSSMPGWIMNEASQQGGKFSQQAAAALAAQVGSDTGQARQEIIKILTYVDGKRAASLEDVQELAAPGGQTDIFSMVDAMAVKDAPLALRHLGRLLEEQDYQGLFGMVVRQFRLLILTKEALAEGIRDDKSLSKRLHVHEFVAGKMLVQAKNYSLTDLEGIYHQLLEIDKMIKTSQIEADVALQTFVAGLAV